MSESPSDTLTFEAALAELEQIVRDLEDGQIGLEQSLARYETGVGLLKRCYRQLSLAEQRIAQLMGVDEDGKPLLRAFEHAATAESESPEPRKRRKKPDDPEKLF